MMVINLSAKTVKVGLTQNRSNGVPCRTKLYCLRRGALLGQFFVSPKKINLSVKFYHPKSGLIEFLSP
jgi:hypothetical protein